MKEPLREAIEKMANNIGESKDERRDDTSQIFDELEQAITVLIQQREVEAELRGMQQAKSRVLVRTEIPSNVKNPTRDYIVILGEEIAGFIDSDIAELTQPTNKDMTPDSMPTAISAEEVEKFRDYDER